MEFFVECADTGQVEVMSTCMEDTVRNLKNQMCHVMRPFSSSVDIEVLGAYATQFIDNSTDIANTSLTSGATVVVRLTSAQWRAPVEYHPEGNEFDTLSIAACARWCAAGSSSAAGITIIDLVEGTTKQLVKHVAVGEVVLSDHLLLYSEVRGSVVVVLGWAQEEAAVELKAELECGSVVRSFSLWACEKAVAVAHANFVSLFCIATGARFRMIDIGHEVLQMTLNQTVKCIACITDATLRVLEVKSGKTTHTFPLGTTANSTVDYSICGTRLAASSGKTVSVFACQGEEERIDVEHTAPVRSMQMSPCARYLFALTADDSVTKWDLRSGVRTNFVALGHDVVAFCVSRDLGHILVSGHRLHTRDMPPDVGEEELALRVAQAEDPLSQRGCSVM